VNTFFPIDDQNFTKIFGMYIHYIFNLRGYSLMMFNIFESDCSGYPWGSVCPGISGVVGNFEEGGWLALEKNLVQKF
jgi:hypothetical protein